ncbi:hypothetical protein A3L09_08530 [Thermococcus profundus]|uniref:DUF835 domain-containing protein n=1 Tax=Thermococcus profundus TaxID=49899 RepID=A0A2Z2MA98_THEPR|nr:DUF835 domain-containing protein [Thermococcus profundus]ASJ03297.1 hypothetical protein A3L09_08530 [Thermococcus profundus]
MDPYLIAAAFSAGVKLAAGGMMLFFSERQHRKTALYWGLAWLIYAYAIIGDVAGNYILGAVSVALFASLLFYGTTKLTGAESSMRGLSDLISFLPLLLVVYAVSVISSHPEDYGVSMLGMAYGISGFFLVLSGILLVGMKDLYGSKSRNLGITLGIYGLHQADYPFLRPVGWFVPVGFSVDLLLTLISVIFMVEFVTVFPVEISSEPVKKDIQEGVFIVSPSEAMGFLRQFHDYPVLAFVRTLQTPRAWRTFRITNVDGMWTVPPTNLPKMLETSVGYMSSLKAKDPNSKPVILLEGLEYLRLYTDFKGLARFLSSLKDYVTVNNGTLVVVLDRNAWEERELKTLERLLK